MPPATPQTSGHAWKWPALGIVALVMVGLLLVAWYLGVFSFGKGAGSDMPWSAKAPAPTPEQVIDSLSVPEMSAQTPAATTSPTLDALSAPAPAKTNTSGTSGGGQPKVDSSVLDSLSAP